MSDLKRSRPECHFEYSGNIDDLCEDLKRRRATDKWPDVPLLEVYWLKFNSKAKVDAVRKETNRILREEVEPAIDRMNAEYLKAFHLN